MNSGIKAQRSNDGFDEPFLLRSVNQYLRSEWVFFGGVVGLSLYSFLAGVTLVRYARYLGFSLPRIAVTPYWKLIQPQGVLAPETLGLISLVHSMVIVLVFNLFLILWSIATSAIRRLIRQWLQAEQAILEASCVEINTSNVHFCKRAVFAKKWLNCITLTQFIGRNYDVQTNIANAKKSTFFRLSSDECALITRYFGFKKVFDCISLLMLVCAAGTMIVSILFGREFGINALGVAASYWGGSLQLRPIVSYPVAIVVYMISLVGPILGIGCLVCAWQILMRRNQKLIQRILAEHLNEA